MARQSRVIIPGLAHHITQRGNNRQIVFRSNVDYALYAELLLKYSRRYSFEILAYCLMPNHIHLIGIPPTKFTVADVLRSSQMHYSQLYNSKYHHCGHLWAGRYFSCPMDERHLYEAVRYVENNPVRAGLVVGPEAWKWSSAVSHIGRVTDPLLSLRTYDFINVDDWSSYLREKIDEECIRKLKAQTRAGSPLGDGEFVRRLEERWSIKIPVRLAKRLGLRAKPDLPSPKGSVPILTSFFPMV